MTTTTAKTPTVTETLRELEGQAAAALTAAEDMTETLDALPDGWAALRSAAQDLQAAAELAAERAGLALDRAEGAAR